MTNVYKKDFLNLYFFESILLFTIRNGYIENVTDICAIETLAKGIGSIAMSLKMLIFVVIYCEYTLLILLSVDKEKDVYVDHRKI